MGEQDDDEVDNILSLSVFLLCQNSAFDHDHGKLGRAGVRVQRDTWLQYA